MEMMNREKKYDLIRVVLVFLVVIGHASYYDNSTAFGGVHYSVLMQDADIRDTTFHIFVKYISNWISTFHMPAFVALSGVFFRKQMEKRKYSNLKELIVTKFKRLIVPLIMVWLFYNIPVKYLSGYYNNISLGRVLLQIVFPNNVYLWYLEALFFDFILCYLLEKIIKNKYVQLFVVLFAWLIGFLMEIRLGEFNPLGNPLKCSLWFWIGENLVDICNFIKSKNLYNNKLLGGLLLIHSVLWYSSIKVDTIINFFGNIIMPFTMILAIIYISDLYVKMNNTKLDKFISFFAKYSFGIYLYSDPLNYLFLYLVFTMGISYFGSTSIAVILYFSRVLFTPAIAIFITRLWMKFGIRFLY